MLTLNVMKSTSVFTGKTINRRILTGDLASKFRLHLGDGNVELLTEHLLLHGRGSGGEHLIGQTGGGTHTLAHLGDT